MRALTVIFFIVLLFATEAFSQTAPAFKYDSAYTTGVSTDFEIVVHNKIYNKSTTSQEFRWVVISSSIPSQWSFSLCDPNTCVENPDSLNFTLNGGDSGLIDLHFYPNDYSGIAKVKILVYPVGNRQKGVIATFVADASGSSIDDKYKPTTFTMYPSSVKDYLNVKFSKKGNHIIEVYNILGRKVLSKEISNTDFMKISFSSLQPGMYVVRFRTENGKIITKSISKE